jgi:hypothetical protein
MAAIIAAAVATACKAVQISRAAVTVSLIVEVHRSRSSRTLIEDFHSDCSLAADLSVETPVLAAARNNGCRS